MTDHRLARVRRASLTMPAVPTGQESVLPYLWPDPAGPVDVQALGADTIDVTGAAVNLFPYRPLEHYGREARPRRFATVVLENELLRAEFLPELGGRLWRLDSKVTGRSLLHTPDRIQLANLALRNAWFCGGIEFNIGTRGHAAHTCEPVGAGIVAGPDGESLRLWEFDRIREVVWQLDVWLPDDSPSLCVGVRIANPNPEPTPMYWWTNAAVPQADDLRVFAPGSTAILTEYPHRLRRVDMTDAHAGDRAAPSRSDQAFDLFFEDGPSDRHWIAAADSSGSGLAMVSTYRARGRKLFGWGTSAGGRQWQRWLSPSGGQYCEVQSGLETTQHQHLVMPGSTQWSWVECYGPFVAERAALDVAYPDAVLAAGRSIESSWSVAALQDASAWHEARAELPVTQVWQEAGGWGTLERLRRRASGAGWVDESLTPFPAEPGPEQVRWAGLLSGAGFPDVAGPPGSFVRGPDWEAALTGVPPTAGSELQLGVMRLARGAVQAAAAHLENSLARRRDPWALLLSALIALEGGDTDAGIAQLEEAARLAPGDPELATESVKALLAAGAPAAADQLLQQVFADHRSPELELLRLRCLAALGRLDELRDALDDPPVLPGVREGETALADLWDVAYPNRAVPPEIDFRMHPAPGRTAEPGR